MAARFMRKTRRKTSFMAIFPNHESHFEVSENPMSRLHYVKIPHRWRSDSVLPECPVLVLLLGLTSTSLNLEILLGPYNG